MAGSLEGVVCGNIGVGAVGSYWTRLQRKEGADVLVYDVNPERAQQVAEDYGCEVATLDELLANSNWVSTALLPLSELPVVMAQISARRYLLKPGSLLLDHSGVKTGILNDKDETSISSMLNAVHDRDDVEIIALHLAFRPDVELEGQNVYVSPVRPIKEGLWLPKVMDMLTSYGANVLQMLPESQDLVTMRHQMIVWGSLFAAFDAMRRSGTDMSFPEVEQLATKLSKPFFDLMKRMVSGNPEVYWQTMLNHPNSIQALELLQDGISDLTDKLRQGVEASASFTATYNHLQAIAETGLPERKTGRSIMVEIYYEHGQRAQVREALRVKELPAQPFSGDVVVSMIDTGRINELRRAGIPAAGFTRYGQRDKRKQPEIAFYVRNVPHPEHPERKGMRFSPMMPEDLEKAQQINPDYTRLQLERLHRDPVVNFFMNVRQDTALSQLQPFVVYKPL